MAKKIIVFILVCLIPICCTSCKNGYDFSELEKTLSEDGEEYNITLDDNGKDLYIVRTETVKTNENSKMRIMNFTPEEFDKWTDSFWYLLCREQMEFEEAFREKGDDFDVHITYRLFIGTDYIGNITDTGVKFKQSDIKISNSSSTVKASNFQWQDDYILPTSSSKYLTYTDCKDLNKEQLEMAIYEILARHGVIFNDKSIQSYFESKKWYNGILPESEVDESTMSELENRNIDVLRDYTTMPGK